MSEQEKRVALVTGGTRGIGRAVVEALLEEGFAVAFCGTTDASTESAMEELRGRWGEQAAGRACNVSDDEAVKELVAWTLEHFGRLDVLVNNAGLIYFTPVDELSGEDWRRVTHTNLDGAFYALREAAQWMREQGSGWILNIVSLAARHPIPGGAAYNASKFGLLGLSDAAMLDLRESGVRVTAILPGSVDTAAQYDRHEDRGWMLRPEDIAQTVVDLLRFPERALPSRVEIRPTKKKSS